MSTPWLLCNQPPILNAALRNGKIQFDDSAKLLSRSFSQSKTFADAHPQLERGLHFPIILEELAIYFSLMPCSGLLQVRVPQLTKIHETPTPSSRAYVASKKVYTYSMTLMVLRIRFVTAIAHLDFVQMITPLLIQIPKQYQRQLTILLMTTETRKHICIYNVTLNKYVEPFNQVTITSTLTSHFDSSFKSGEGKNERKKKY